MRSTHALRTVSSVNLLYGITTTIMPGSSRQAGAVKSSDLPPPIGNTTTSVVSTSSMIRFSATSCSTDPYVRAAFLGLPSAFLTARSRSSSLGRVKLETAAGGSVGECGDGSPLTLSRCPCSSGDPQKLSLPQLLKVDAANSVPGAARVPGFLGVAGAMLPGEESAPT